MKFFYLSLLPVSLLSCGKFLEKVPDPSLAIPTTVSGFRELLDNDLITNNSTPGLGILGSDDIMLNFTTWQTTDPTPKSAYIWEKEIYEDDAAFPWSAPYKVIYYCNVVMDWMPGVAIPDAATQREYDAVIGTALFTRAFQFQNLEETFGQIFRPGLASSAMGIPLRLVSDPHLQVGRASVQQVYDQIIKDLKRSIPLLPDEVQFTRRNRPCKPAAYALLSRAYLSIQDYDNGRIYADSCLRLYNKLVDYDTVNAAASRPFSISGNDEVLYQCTAVNFRAQSQPSTQVDTLLYGSYAADDLRKSIFFKASGTGHYFRAHYSGRTYLFSGLAVDEVYLTRAECYARMGRDQEALADLNALLTRRWKKGTFQPYEVATAGDVLSLVLAERRKETLFRETRWADLRRLNQEGHAGGALRRVLNDNEYLLTPGDPRYAYPIPKEEVRLGDIPQNPR